MLIRTAGRTCVEAPAAAEPADDVVMNDYYTRLPQIRLTANSTGRAAEPKAQTEVMLDGNDVAQLVECALRHPAANMRYAVLAAIWNHAASLQQIFRFGLEPPHGYEEIRGIVAAELEKHSRPPESAAATRARPAEALLPRMPLPPHLQNRAKR